MGWIYAFRDSRYSKGIKIGWDGTNKGNQRIIKAQSYTPAEILYEAAWEIPLDFKLQAGSYKQVEFLAKKGLPVLNFPNNGTEWFDINTAFALDKVTQNLGIKPQQIGWKTTINWDDFRSPRDIEKPAFHKQKQVLWVYEEHLTGRIKVQRIDEWKTPREKVKTYSRNGFKPLIAYTYPGKPNRERNLEVLELWKGTMGTFSAPEDNSTYGWLPEGVDFPSVASLLRKSGLAILEPPFNTMPEGVLPSYN